MKLPLKQALLLVFLFPFMYGQAQSYWIPKEVNSITQKKKSSMLLPSQYKTYELDIKVLKKLLAESPLRGSADQSDGVEILFPVADGTMKTYKVIEAPVFDEELSARYPEIKSYAGQGIDDPSEMIRFSVSPLGLKSMLFSANNGYEFIEPFTEDLSHYIVYQRKDRHRGESDFECTLKDAAHHKITHGNPVKNNADDGLLRTYRLAVSTNGEYTNYFGGTVALALAAINTTMTRVNGIFESDFNVTMTLIANTTDVIYTNANTDPYGSNSGQWNSQVQNTLTSNIGEANYDIGHLFALGGNNGNAGCIGCVCVNNQKGSAFTSRTTPEGDPFDVDYVAHEMGHQYGGNHTWTFGGNEGTNVQMEPGSGSTIMGYAGITGNTDVQANSDPYFHAVSIEQITDYIKTTSCQTNTNTGNTTPTANAGSNYTIPRGTPFVLTGTGTDADGDALTYCWEQMDENNASTTYPSVSATTGVAFRSFNPTSSNQRTFPALATVLSGSTATTWEAVPNVGRTMNFRFTVRDNVAGGGSNESDNMVVTVNGTAGPFVVSAPNTNVNWSAGSSQTVSWDVAGTTASPVSTANVNILLSTDGGNTFPITLAANTANDGSQSVIVPNNVGTTNRIKVEAVNNIFFDISNQDFEISGSVPCTATTPTGLAASGITDQAATLSWNAVAGASSYDLRYRETGTSTWTTISVSGVSSTLSGLSSTTEYEAQVRSVCPDNSTSAYSASVVFTTTDVQLVYCDSNGNNTSDEYIGNVTIGNINNTTGASSGGYGDYTAISTDLTKDQSENITITPVWTGTIYAEGYSVWIDYNQDGDFEDAGEQVFTQSATTSTPINGSFTVPASAMDGNTRMRVSLKYNDIPDPCESFTWGEVEDYTVNIVDVSCNVGDPCDDGDACTTGDVYDANCNCSGTFQDADSDGVCDADDLCPGSAAGEAVDGNGCVQGCTDSNASNYNPNAQVDDGSCLNCNPGDSCDDGDACTTGDVYDSNCNCSGTFQDADGDGVCDADDQCPGSAGGASVDANGCVPGCTDSGAHNYDPDAQVDDGSCETCSDGIQNGDETGTDCGGSCDPCAGCNYVEIDNNDFESGWGIWNDGGSDCRRSANDDNYANSGIYCVRLRDNSSTSVMTTDNIDLSGYDEAKVSFSYIARSMDNSNEDFWLQISTNGGSSYTTVEEWNRGDEFENLVRENDEVTITGPFTSNTRFRFRCDASGNSDWVYIDDVVISACSNTARGGNEETSEKLDVVTQMNIQPNPASDNLTVSILANRHANASVVIMNTAGKTVLSERFGNHDGWQAKQLDLSGLTSGIYLVTLLTDNEKITKRLIITQ